MATLFLGQWHANKADGTLPQSLLLTASIYSSLCQCVRSSSRALPAPALLVPPPAVTHRKPEMLCTGGTQQARWDGLVATLPHPLTAVGR